MYVDITSVIAMAQFLIGFYRSIILLYPVIFLSNLIVGQNYSHVHLVEVVVLLHASLEQVFQIVEFFGVAFHVGGVDQLVRLSLSQFDLKLV